MADSSKSSTEDEAGEWEIEVRADNRNRRLDIRITVRADLTIDTSYLVSFLEMDAWRFWQNHVTDIVLKTIDKTRKDSVQLEVSKARSLKNFLRGSEV